MTVFVDGWTLTHRNLLRLRHEPGTLLTIMLHMLANLTACIQAAIKVEWLG